MEWTNYNHIFYFWTVARHGSVRLASEELGLSQPTVSEQLHKLEESLGRKLFERAGRGIRLSEDGKLLFSYAERIFQLGGEMREAMAGRTTGPQLLRVGVVHSLPALVAHRLLAPALRGEAMRLVCTADRPESLYAKLALHQLDAVLSDAPMQPSSQVRGFSHRLAQCGVSFFAAHKPKGGPRFPRSLDGAPFLMPERGTPLHSSLERWFERQQLRPEIAGEFSDSAMLERFAQRGLGAFAAPAIIERELRSDYKLELLGRTTEIVQEFYAISAERKITHAGVRAIIEAAAKTAHATVRDTPLAPQRS
jgi:LysR family transcriptional activator of nhaA